MEKDGFTLTLAGIVAAVAAWWGGADGWLKALFMLSMLDILAGTFRAMHEDKFLISVARDGANKKAMMAVLITSTIILQAYVTEEIGYTAPLTTAVAGFYIGIELLSILRHAYAMGVPIPGVLVDVGTKIEKLMGGTPSGQQAEGKGSGYSA